MSAQEHLIESVCHSISWLDKLLELGNRRPITSQHRRVLHLGVSDVGSGSQFASRQNGSSPIWNRAEVQLDGVAARYPDAPIAGVYDILWVTPLSNCDPSVVSNADEILWTDPDLAAMRWGRDSILTNLQREMSVQSTLTLVFSVKNQGRSIEAIRRGFIEWKCADATIASWTKPDPRYPTAN